MSDSADVSMTTMSEEPELVTTTAAEATGMEEEAVEVPPETTAAAEGEALDRTQHTPFLLRLFVKENGRHSVHDFKGTAAEGHWRAADGEVRTYAWADTTLADLAALVHRVRPATAAPDTRLKFAEVGARARAGPPFLRPLGSTRVGVAQAADRSTLGALGFRAGNWLDVAAEHWTDADERAAAAALAEKKAARASKRPRDEDDGGDDDDGGSVATNSSSSSRRRRRRHRRRH